MPYTAVVAEDDELVRIVAADMLIDAGFTVLEAGHATEALEHLHAQAEMIHLLFTDINMPGAMDGLALAHHSCRTWPWVRVLIASARPAPARHEMPNDCRFLPKPYGFELLTRHALELVAAN